MWRSLFPNARVVFRASAAAQGTNRKRKTNKAVLVLGWGGASLKNLRKVQDYYNSRAVDSFAFVMPMGIPLFMRDAFEAEIADEIKARAVSSLHAVHIFSNNGTWAYGEMSAKGCLLPNVERVVMDSAPILRYRRLSVLEEVTSYTGVITAVVLRKPSYSHPVVSPLVAAVLAPYCLFSRAMLTLQEALPALKLRLVLDYPVLNRYLRDSTPSVPTLMLYTAGDRLVPPAEVLAFRDHLAKRGVPVESFDLGDHPHCNGFFRNQDQCTAKLDAFLGLDPVRL